MVELSDLYYISSPSKDEDDMKKFIMYSLPSDVKYQEDVYGNVYLTKGHSKKFPCFCAHLDEVHSPNKNIEIVTVKDSIFGWNTKNRQQTGIGADDKNGIYCCLKLVEKIDNVKVILFVEEEIGCKGSAHCDMDFFNDVRWVIQLDRKGNSDFITSIMSTKLCSHNFIKEFSDTGKKYGYKETSGMMTDVLILKENGLNVSCCNLSCGYYNPHTENEVTSIKDVNNAINLCIEITHRMINIYSYTYQKPKYSNVIYNSWNSKYIDWDDDDNVKYDFYKKNRLNSSYYYDPRNKNCQECFNYDCTNCKKKYLGIYYNYNDSPF